MFTRFGLLGSPDLVFPHRAQFSKSHFYKEIVGRARAHDPVPTEGMRASVARRGCSCATYSPKV